MPTYEYFCSDCEHTFEEFQKMSDAPIQQCPECGLNNVSKLMSGGSGLIFKGSGFYITDYKDSKGKKTEKPKAKKETKKPKDKK